MSRDPTRTGKRYERLWVNLLREFGFITSRVSAVLEQMRLGPSGVDIRAQLGAVQLAIQCRDRRRPNVFAAIADAERGALLDEIPVAVVRKVNGPWPTPATDLVVLTRQGFFALLEQLRPH